METLRTSEIIRDKLILTQNLKLISKYIIKINLRNKYVYICHLQLQAITWVEFHPIANYHKLSTLSQPGELHFNIA